MQRPWGFPSVSSALLGKLLLVIFCLQGLGAARVPHAGAVAGGSSAQGQQVLDYAASSGGDAGTNLALHYHYQQD